MQDVEVQVEQTPDTGDMAGPMGPIEMGGDGLVDLAVHRFRVIRVKTIPSYC